MAVVNQNLLDCCSSESIRLSYKHTFLETIILKDFPSFEKE